MVEDRRGAAGPGRFIFLFFYFFIFLFYGLLIGAVLQGQDVLLFFFCCLVCCENDPSNRPVQKRAEEATRVGF